MEKNNRLKLRISRMFRSSFGSCRSRNVSDVTEKAIFSSLPHQTQLKPTPLPPKSRPFPSICKPRYPETTAKVIVTRSKVSEEHSPFVLTKGRMCPLVSPISPLMKDPYYEKKKKKKRTQTKKKNTRLLSSSSHDSFKYGSGRWWFSSDEEEEEQEDKKEDETETLFSSKSLTSDYTTSSESLRHRYHRRNKKEDMCRPYRRMLSSSSSSTKKKNISSDGVLPEEAVRVKDSFAVVKSSSDPYNDFRTSMVEMIVEKQIFAAKDLEQLLQCFLSLNSFHHHRIIVEVFTEIWEALFSDWF